MEKKDIHISDLDYRKVDCPDFEPDEDAMIISTRMRVARNLADFPLGPAVTKSQRLEIEEWAVNALDKFEGVLSGTYHSLATISGEE